MGTCTSFPTYTPLPVTPGSKVPRTLQRLSKLTLKTTMPLPTRITLRRKPGEDTDNAHDPATDNENDHGDVTTRRSTTIPERQRERARQRRHNDGGAAAENDTHTHRDQDGEHERHTIDDAEEEADNDKGTPPRNETHSNKDT